MKKILCTAIMAMGMTTVALAQEAKLEISEVQNDKGMVYIMLEKQGEKTVYLSAKPATGSVTVALPQMTAGEWLASVIHDENDNKTMDYTPEGKPKEGFARMKVAIDTAKAEKVQVTLTYMAN